VKVTGPSGLSSCPFGASEDFPNPPTPTDAPISYSPGKVKRGYFLGDYMGLESLSGNDVINFYASSICDGTDVWSRRATHP
jgi:hypothetical protein